MKWAKNLITGGGVGGGSNNTSTGGSRATGGVGGGGRLSVQRVYVVNMPRGGLGSSVGGGVGGGFTKFLKFAAGAGLVGLAIAAVGGTVVALSEAVKATAGPIVDKKDFAAQAFGTKNPKAFDYTNQRYVIAATNYTAPTVPQKVEVAVDIKHDSELFTSEVKSIASDEISYQSWSR